MNYEQIIYTQLLTDGMPEQLALLIVAQSKHETANYTSSVFKSCNNAFGYKYVGQKLALSACNNAPEGGSYAKYATVGDSAREIAQWIKRRQAEGRFPANLATITTAEQYAGLLKMAGYYGDSVTNYTAGLLNWFKTNITPIAGISGTAIALAAIALFF